MTPLDLQWLRESHHQWEEEMRTRRRPKKIFEDEGPAVHRGGAMIEADDEYEHYGVALDEADDPNSTPCGIVEPPQSAGLAMARVQAMIEIEKAKAEADTALAAANRLRSTSSVGTTQWPELPSERVQAAWAAIAIVGTFGTAAALTFGVKVFWAAIAPYAATLLGLIAILEFAFIQARIGSPTIRAVDALFGTHLDARLRLFFNPETSEMETKTRPVEAAPSHPALATTAAASPDLRAIVSEHAPGSMKVFDEADAVLALAGRARDATTDPILRERIDSVLSKVDGLTVSLAAALDLADRAEKTQLAQEAVQSLTILAAAADHERALVQRSARDAFEQQRRYIESAHPDAGDLRPIE